ncbi:hypothetical protein ZIOFF_017430 [Zingiber officinale]|uniref:Uncharacterized protein n=1 Tax=Zingiber officinale TaxID=94328 RepID=A0A8J5LIA1_ZINOF|nr:hypothetical protein ZIOFF_017430 [Zingiber officinale]
MGCAASKLEGEDLRPGPYSVQRKIMEVKRPPRRGRRLSTVSTTELLRSSDADGEHGVGKLAAVEELPEEKGRRLWQRVAGDEQLPGSPSFRFYFAGSTDADESDDGSEIFQKGFEFEMNKGTAISNLTEMANAEPYQLPMSKYFGLAGKWCSTLSCQCSISKQMIKVLHREEHQTAASRLKMRSGNEIVDVVSSEFFMIARTNNFAKEC